MSLVSGIMIAGLIIAFMIALVTEGGAILTNIGELAIIISGFGVMLGYQLGSSMKKSLGSFIWSMGFSGTILIAFLVIAILENQSVAPLLIVILGTSIGGFALLVLSGEIRKIAALEEFLNKWFRWIGAGLLVFHISVAYLYPSLDAIVYQLTNGVTDPNLVAMWSALLVVMIGVLIGIHYFDGKPNVNSD